jgi:DNA mismatch repair protein MLH3
MYNSFLYTHCKSGVMLSSNHIPYCTHHISYCHTIQYRKFILVKVNGMLLCLDQHAAHERVRLEQLEQQLYCSNNNTDNNNNSSNSSTVSVVPTLRRSKLLQSKLLQKPYSIDITTSDSELLKAQLPQLQSWGFKLQLQQPQLDAVTVHVQVHAVPTVCGVQLSCKDLMSLVHYYASLSSALHSTARLPHMQHILKYKACHGAIRFGDTLQLYECEQIVQQLSQCSLPFQCAHGRPNVVPLISIDMLQQQHSTST